MNLFAVFDLTVPPRLKRTLFAGTRWGDENVHIVPAPGDPRLRRLLQLQSADGPPWIRRRPTRCLRRKRGG